MRDPPLAQRFQLEDGTYGMNDLADMHEVMDEEAEYRERAQAAAEAKAKRKKGG